MESKMSDNQEERRRKRQERQNNRKRDRENRQGSHSGNNPGNPEDGNSQGRQQGNSQDNERRRSRNQRNSHNQPENGNNTSGNGNSQGGSQGNTPSQQPRGPLPADTPDFDGQSHAYDFNLPYGKKQKEKSPTKGGGGDAYKPYKVEWSKFNGDNKKLIMEYLDSLFQYLFLECPLEAITNLTILSVDWFLYAPFNGGSSKPEKKEKENKTILDYRDDVRDEYSAKAVAGLKMSVQAHKELKDNIEKAKHGIQATWKEWGGEPTCFRAFVELAQKAEADPNSEEAKRWKHFEKCPERLEIACKKEEALRYFSLTLAAADAATNPQSMEIPKKVSKKFDELLKIVLKSSDIVALKDRVAEKINETKALVTTGSPIDSAISEKLDEMQNIISSYQNNDVNKIKMDLNKKIRELKTVNAFPKVIKANSQVYYNSISDNIDKILEVYSGQPTTARDEIKKYIEQIKTSIDCVEKETQIYVKERTLDIKKLRRNKVKKRIENAKKAIDQFELSGTPISQRQQAAEKHPCPLSANKQAILNSITNYIGS